MITSLLDKVYDSDFYDFFGAEYHELEMIENLLKYAIVSEKEKEMLYNRLKIDAFTSEEAIKVIEYLSLNQVDRIKAGYYYTQTDIKLKLKQWKSY